MTPCMTANRNSAHFKVVCCQTHMQPHMQYSMSSQLSKSCFVNHSLTLPLNNDPTGLLSDVRNHSRNGIAKFLRRLPLHALI